MPTAMPYNPTPSVNPSLGGIGYLSVPNATPEAFGAGVGKALQGVGQSLEGAADTALKVGLQNQAIVNEAGAHDLAAQGMENLAKVEQQFKQLQGQDAVNAFPQYQKDLAKVREDVLAGAQNPLQKQMVDQLLFRQYSYGLTNGASHAATMAKQYKTTADNAIEKNQTDAAANSPDLIQWRDKQQVAEETLRNNRVGENGDKLPPEEVDRLIKQHRTESFASFIKQQAEVDPLKAYAMFNAERSTLEQDKVPGIASYLRTQMNQKGASEIAEQAANGTPISTYNTSIGTPGLIKGKVTTYSPQTDPNSPQVKMEGGNNDAHDTPIYTFADYVNSGNKGKVVVAGSKQFDGNEYIVPKLTAIINGEEVTRYNVPVVVRDTGSAFTNAPEGRFDIPVDRNMSDADMAKQPFNKTGLDFLPVRSADSKRGSANLMSRGVAWGDPNSPTFAAENIVDLKLPDGKTIQVNKYAKLSFQGFLQDLAATGYDISTVAGYNVREIAGTNTPSQHSWGNAIDINADQNPNRNDNVKITNLPDNISDLAAKWGLSWGGDWKTKKDTMHFEWTGVVTPAMAAAGGGRLELPQSTGPKLVNAPALKNGPLTGQMTDIQFLENRQQLEQVLNAAYPNPGDNQFIQSALQAYDGRYSKTKMLYNAEQNEIAKNLSAHVLGFGDMTGNPNAEPILSMDELRQNKAAYDLYQRANDNTKLAINKQIETNSKADAREMSPEDSYNYGVMKGRILAGEDVPQTDIIGAGYSPAKTRELMQMKGAVDQAEPATTKGFKTFFPGFMESNFGLRQGSPQYNYILSEVATALNTAKPEGKQLDINAIKEITAARIIQLRKDTPDLFDVATQANITMSPGLQPHFNQVFRTKAASAEAMSGIQNAGTMVGQVRMISPEAKLEMQRQLIDTDISVPGSFYGYNTKKLATAYAQAADGTQGPLMAAGIQPAVAWHIIKDFQSATKRAPTVDEILQIAKKDPSYGQKYTVNMYKGLTNGQ